MQSKRKYQHIPNNSNNAECITCKYGQKEFFKKITRNISTCFKIKNTLLNSLLYKKEIMEKRKYFN